MFVDFQVQPRLHMYRPYTGLPPDLELRETQKCREIKSIVTLEITKMSGNLKIGFFLFIADIVLWHRIRKIH